MTESGSAGVGTRLRGWRERRRLSQLELSLRAEVSTRHLSYVENGRSRPTADMILRLADQLEVPLAERNHLLLAGGYAPRYRSRGLDDDSIADVMAGLRALLDAHHPFPALLVDSRFDLVDANRVVDALVAGCAPALLAPPVNVLRLTLHPDGLAPRIRNLPAWSAHLLAKLRHRAEATGDPVLHDLRSELAAYVDVAVLPPPPADPVLTLDLDHDGVPLRLLSISAHIENAADVTLADLRLETFLPADARTRDVVTGLAG